MIVDWVVKKSFSGLILALLALNAYFQASAVTRLIAASLLDRGLPAARAAAPRARIASSPREPTLATAILARNPFDSVTGPLVPSAQSSGGWARQPHGVEDPLAAPVCADIAASIISESTDHSWSLASLQANGEPSPRMRRIGDAIGDKQVTFIAYNPRENSPAVWLTQGEEVCQVLLFRGAPPSAPAAEPTSKPASSQVPPDIAQQIHKLSDNEFQIDRKLVDRLLEDQSLLMRGVRIVPERQDGNAVGIRLWGIRPDSVLGMLGLRSGDRLDSINGYNVANPEMALQAYARLRFASKLDLRVNRGGATIGIEYQIM